MGMNLIVVLQIWVVLSRCGRPCDRRGARGTHPATGAGHWVRRGCGKPAPPAHLASPALPQADPPSTQSLLYGDVLRTAISGRSDPFGGLPVNALGFSPAQARDGFDPRVLGHATLSRSVIPEIRPT